MSLDPSSLQDVTFGSNELIYVPGSPLPITVEEFEDEEVVDDVNVIPTAPPRTKVAKTSCAGLSQPHAFTLDQSSPLAAPETLPRTRRGKTKPKSDPLTEPVSNPKRLYATVPPRTKYSTVSLYSEVIQSINALNFPFRYPLNLKRESSLVPCLLHQHLQETRRVPQLRRKEEDPVTAIEVLVTTLRLKTLEPAMKR